MNHGFPLAPEPVFPFVFPLDKEILVREFQFFFNSCPAGHHYQYSAGKSLAKNSTKASNLWVYNLENLDELASPELKNQIQGFLKSLEIKETPLFTFLSIQGGTTLGWHVDDALCSFNILLSDSTVPVSFEDSDYHYSQALIDVSQKHRVVNTEQTRGLFRMSFREQDFLWTKKRLQAKFS